MPDQSIILYSCGSPLIVDYFEVCQNNGLEIEAVINNIDRFYEYPNLRNSVTVDFSGISSKFLVPLFTPRNRFLAVQEAMSKKMIPLPMLVDLSSLLPTIFDHGVGCFINKGVIIGSHSKLGEHVLINRGACLGHHLVCEDYVSIGPGVVTGGNVTIKRGALIGTGAILLPGVQIGAQAIVGGGAVVTKDVGDYEIVVGNPARGLRNNDLLF